MQNFFAIDCHTHILPKTWPDLQEKYGYGGFVKLEHVSPCCANMMIGEKSFRRVSANCWDLETRLQECDQFQINLQVLATVPVMFSYWAKPADTHDLSKRLNDHIADAIAQYPKRFLGLGTLPMQDTELAIQELERCKSLRLSGVQIGTHVNGKNLDDPDFFPIFQAAQDLDLAIFIHPWDMLAKERMPKYWLPWLVGMPTETTLAICSLIFGGVLARLEKLRIGFAHGGGSFLGTLGRIRHGFQARPDLCATTCAIDPAQFLNRIYFDTLVHDPEFLKYFLKHVPVSQLFLGSDYPFPLGETEIGQIIYDSDLDEASKAAMFGHNAANWLNINLSDYQ